MKKLKKAGIGTRLFLSFVAFSAIILGLLWAVQTLFLEDFYKSVKFARAGNALNAVESALQENGVDGIQETIDTVGDYYDVSIAIYDQSLAKLACTRAIPNDSISGLRGGEVTLLYKKAVDNGGSYTERFHDKGPNIPAFVGDSTGKYNQTTRRDGETKYGEKTPPERDIESVITVSVLTYGESGESCTVFLNSVLTPVTDTVETLKVQLTAISVVTVLAALVLAVLLSRQISKPIVRMNDTAASLAKGNYDVHFDESASCREVGELSRTLNYATNELSQVDRLRSELIANISHDLRTPLTMIAGYAEMMRDIPGENSAENAEIIIQESKRLTTLVNDVLDLSKYKAEADGMHPAAFCITDTIRSILGRFTKFTEANGYTVRFEPDEPLCAVGDEAKIQQVIYNLVGNSINYTGADKTVLVRQLREDGCVRVEVIDSGEGISEDDLSHIFERYYRSSRPHKRPTVGTGLGLSIVKSILDAHDAKYGVITSVGQGSVFWFRLPLPDGGEPGAAT